MKTYFLFFLLMVPAVSEAITAYPIPPVPLRELVNEAELIVDVYVMEKETSSTVDPFEWNNGSADLKVNEIVKGAVLEKYIAVLTNPGLVCPAPAKYIPGKRVLAFLAKNKKGEYYTCSLSYGAKELDGICMAEYKKQIQELLLINKITDPDNRDVEIADWIVQCALNNCTKYEGLIELTPGLWHGDEFVELPVLTKEHKRLLKALILDDYKKEKYIDVDLALLVADKEEEEIIKIFKEKYASTRQNEWSVENYMYGISELVNNKELKRIYQKYKSRYTLDLSVVEESALIQEFSDKAEIAY